MNRRKRKKQPEAAFRRLMRATLGPTSVRKMRRLMNAVVSERMKWLKEYWKLRPEAKEVAMARARLDAEALVRDGVTGSDLMDATAYYLQRVQTREAIRASTEFAQATAVRMPNQTLYDGEGQRIPAPPRRRL